MTYTEKADKIGDTETIRHKVWLREVKMFIFEKRRLKEKLIVF